MYKALEKIITHIKLQLCFFVLTNLVASRFGLKLRSGTVIASVAPEPVFPHSKLYDVMNQRECINEMRAAADGSFIYMTYTVPKSSELYSPSALRYHHQPTPSHRL